MDATLELPINRHPRGFIDRNSPIQTIDEWLEATLVLPNEHMEGAFVKRPWSCPLLDQTID